MNGDDPIHAVVPRAAHDVRARRRPGYVLLVYAYRAAGAIVLSLPLALAAGEVVAAYPRGDAELFDPGGIMALEAARVLAPSALPLAFQAASVALLLGFAGLLPLAMLLEALGLDDGASVPCVLRRALDRLGTLSLLLGVAVLAEGLGSAILLYIGGKTFERVAWSAAAHRDLSEIMLFAGTLALALAAGVTHDLARAYAVRKRFGFYDSIAHALRAMRRTGPRAYLAYLWRAAIGAAGIVAALAFASREDITTSAGFAAIAIAGQAALVLAAAMRASWLAAAIRFAERVDEDEATELSHREALAEPSLVESVIEKLAEDDDVKIEETDRKDPPGGASHA